MKTPKPLQLKFDMSQEAVDQRLRDVSELFRLGMSLQKATYLGKAKDILRSKNLLPTVEANNQMEGQPLQQDQFE